MDHAEVIKASNQRPDHREVLGHPRFSCLELTVDLVDDELGVAEDFYLPQLQASGDLQGGNQCLVLCLVVGSSEVEAEGICKLKIARPDHSIFTARKLTSNPRLCGSSYGLYLYHHACGFI